MRGNEYRRSKGVNYCQVIAIHLSMDAASQIITLVKMTRVNVVVVVVVEAVCLCEQQAGGRGLVEHCARQEN